MNRHTHHGESASNRPISGDSTSADLSPAARERKAAILASLQGDLRALRTRRSLARGGAVAVLLLSTSILVWFLQRPLPVGGGRGEGLALKPPRVDDAGANAASKPLPEGEAGVGSIASTITTIGRSRTTPPARPEAPKIIITHIQTDPTTLDRLATKPTRSRIEQISDDELLHAMQEAGRPAGLIRANGKLTIVEQRDANTVVGG